MGQMNSNPGAFPGIVFLPVLKKILRMSLANSRDFMRATENTEFLKGNIMA
jgi:hypothetical protein